MNAQLSTHIFFKSLVDNIIDKVLINQEVYDGYTRGEYILKDETVVVISEEGTTLLVKKSDSAE